MASQTVPILIVGAGPTGLNLANLLTSYGINYRLIEQKADVLHTSNALALQPRSLEMWNSMGLAQKAIAQGKKILGLALNSATKPIGQINLANAGLETQFPFILGLPQSDSEALLTQHLMQQGGKVEHNCTLLNVAQTDKEIIAQLQHATGEIETITCDWLVAADGSHSSIRKKLNLDFIGAAIPEKFIMMDAEVSADLNPDFFHAMLSPLGPLVFAPLRDFTRIICTVTHDAGISDYKNPTLADFEYIIKKRCRMPVKITKPFWISHFVTHHRLIQNYCQGRIIFAGDSAHIHSPVGGQGMNTGMQDTFNLAWKLALLCKNKAGIKILQTYNSERREIAKEVLKNTTRMTRLVALKNPLLIYLRNYIVGFILRINILKKAFVVKMSELGIRYSRNRIIINNGMRAPDELLLNSNNELTPLHNLLHGLKHKILIFTGTNCSNTRIENILEFNEWVKKNIDDICETIIISTIPHDFHTNAVYLDETHKAHQKYSLEQGGICIIRPDQYIGLQQEQINQREITAYFLAISQ